MAKKKAVVPKDDVDGGEVASNVVGTEEVNGVVFVNREKLARARDIVQLVSGKRVPKTEGEQEQKDRYAAHFAASDIDPKKADAVQFAYELLGGLVRTEDEQAEAEAEAAAKKKKFGKKKIEADVE